MGFSIQRDKTPLPDNGSDSFESGGSEPGEMPWVSIVSDELDLEPDKLDRLIEEKKSEFDGLLTLDSAAAILIAKDRGIDVVEIHSDRPDDAYLAIGNIVTDMRDVRTRAKVTGVSDINSFDGGQVANAVIADSSGKTQLTGWDDDAELLQKLQVGDIITTEGCYTKREISDYQNDRFDGVPSVQIGDDARIVIEKEQEDVELIG